MEKCIVLFRPISNYGANVYFIEDLAKGFSILGYKVFIINAFGDINKVQKELGAAFQYGKPRLIFGINGDGQFNINGKSIYDLSGLTYASLFVDHPIYHAIRFAKIPQNNPTTFWVDKKHLDSLSSIFKIPGRFNFLPHGGSKGTNAHKRFKDRENNLMFAGSGNDPDTIYHSWQDSDPFVKDFLTNAVDLIEGDEWLSVHETFEKLESIVEPLFSLGNKAEIYSKLLISLESYVSAKKRFEILKGLDRQGIHVDIYGEGWEFASFVNHSCKGPLPYSQLLDQIGNYKMFVNISFMFMHGAHERIFNSMLNGSLTLTNESSFVSEMNRTELNSINYLNPEELADKVDFYNENPKNQEEIAVNARDFALENHTWRHRADQILKETKEHG